MFSLEISPTPQKPIEVYNQLYRQGWLPSRIALFTWLLRRFSLRPGTVLLDVACGRAELAQLVRQAGVSYYGLDFAAEALRNETNPGLLVGDGLCLPFADDFFDYIVNIGSLEHFQEMVTGVSEMVRVLKPGGRACILVPNAYGLTWNVLQVWRTGDLADDGAQPIQRFGTRAAWEELFTDHGLKLTRVLGYERAWPGNLADWRLYVEQPKEMILAVIGLFLPLNLKRNFVFIGTK
jgi:SAM-dependent methyltransferase